MEEKFVKVPLSRYEELLDTEARKNVLIAMVRAAEIISTTDLFRILGYEGEARKIQKQEETKYEKYRGMKFSELLGEKENA